MKLIRCHVTTFGCLSDYKVEFSKELNSFLQENGEGKSTFAAFIKAMLYGMDNYRKNATSFMDRVHYLPFQGGKFGGSLTVEFKDKEYKIERQFDDKSKTKDQLKIYDNLGNELSQIEGKTVDNDFPVGDIFVGIDEAAFKKSNFIYSNDLNFEINDSIKMKINDLVVDLTKENSYSDVVKNIDADLKENRKDAKNFGDTYPDKIKHCKQENEELGRKIRLIRDYENELIETYENFNLLQQKIDEIKIRKQELNKTNITKDNWHTLEAMEVKLKEHQGRLDILNQKYPENMPSDKDFKTLEELKNQAAIIQIDIDKSKESLEDKLFIESYNQRYKGDEIDRNLYETLNSEYISIMSQESTKETYEEPNNEKLNLLKTKFDVEHILPLERVNKDCSDYKYNKEKLEKMTSANGVPARKIYPNSKDIEEANEKINKYTSKGNELTSIESSYKEPSAFLRVLLIIFTLGIYFFISKKKRKAYNEKRLKLSNEIKQLADDLDVVFNKFEVEGPDYALKLQKLIVLESAKTADSKIEEIDTLNNKVLIQGNDLREYFAKFGFESDELEISHNAYIQEYKEYKNLVERKEQYDNQISQTDDKVKKRKYNLNEKLNKYFSSDLPISNKLSKLVSDISKKEKYDEKISFLLGSESKKAANSAKIKEILDKYSIPFDKAFGEIYSELLVDFDNYRMATKSLKERKEEIEKFKIEKNLTVREDEDVDAILKELDIEEELKKVEINSYDARIKEREAEIAREDDYVSAIQENTALIARYEHEISIIDKAKAFIEQAETKLEEKYLSPVKEKFDRYAALIKKEIGINTKMNFDYNITREVNGQTTGCEYLSDGENTIVMLALRFAVIDNLYKDNDTFVILDDPLIFLDSKNLEKAKGVIRELSKDKQIIYFACHESRKI